MTTSIRPSTVSITMVSVSVTPIGTEAGAAYPSTANAIRCQSSIKKR